MCLFIRVHGHFFLNTASHCKKLFCKKDGHQKTKKGLVGVLVQMGDRDLHIAANDL